MIDKCRLRNLISCGHLTRMELQVAAAVSTEYTCLGH